MIPTILPLGQTISIIKSLNIYQILPWKYWFTLDGVVMHTFIAIIYLKWFCTLCKVHLLKRVMKATAPLQKYEGD